MLCNTKENNCVVNQVYNAFCAEIVKKLDDVIILIVNIIIIIIITNELVRQEGLSCLPESLAAVCSLPWRWKDEGRSQTSETL